MDRDLVLLNKIANYLRLGDPGFHGYSNNHFVKVRGPLLSCMEKNNFDCLMETGNEQQFPVLKSDVLLTHSFTPTSSLCELCCSITMSTDTKKNLSGLFQRDLSSKGSLYL